MNTREPSLRLITSTVLVAHLTLGGFLLYFAPSPPPKPLTLQKLLVKTVKLNSRPQAKAPEKEIASIEPIKEEAPKEAVKEPVAATPVSTPAPTAAPTPAPKPTPKPAPSLKQPPKTAPKPTPKPAPKPTPKKEPPPPPKSEPKNLALIAQLEGSLAKIETKAHKRSESDKSAFESIKLPSKIGSLSSEALSTDILDQESGAALSPKERTIGERTYRDELISRLKLKLKLPECGVARVNLTLGRGGQVIKVDLISSESAQNRDYLKRELSRMTFPPFGDNFGRESSHTFSLTFSGD